VHWFGRPARAQTLSNPVRLPHTNNFHPATFTPPRELLISFNIRIQAQSNLKNKPLAAISKKDSIKKHKSIL